MVIDPCCEVEGSARERIGAEQRPDLDLFCYESVRASHGERVLAKVLMGREK
ncbi:MAG: hypothetical protein WCL53_08475 [Chloroflexota bacterium]